MCANKFIRSNHRIMEVYVEVQAAIVQKRIEEMNAQAMQAQAALEQQNQTQSTAENHQ